MSPFFQTLVSTIIGAIFGGSGVTFLTFLIQRRDRKMDNNKVTSPDFEKGYLKAETIVIKHHDVVEFKLDGRVRGFLV